MVRGHRPKPLPVDPVAIRPGVEADIAALRAIEVEAGQRFRSIGLDVVADDDPPSANLLLTHVRGGTIWVAEGSAGNPLGYATASVVDGEGHLDQVSVLPDAGGRGIGAALVDRVCRWSAHHGHGAVTLTTYRDVAWNGPYYRRLGFVDLADDRLPPGLAAIRAEERRRGLDAQPRVAMRRPRG